MPKPINIEKLADQITEEIMPHNRGPKINRIVVMSGTWPDNEQDQGGFNRESFRDTIKRKLEECAVTTPKAGLATRFDGVRTIGQFQKLLIEGFEEGAIEIDCVYNAQSAHMAIRSASAVIFQCLGKLSEQQALAFISEMWSSLPDELKK